MGLWRAVMKVHVENRKGVVGCADRMKNMRDLYLREDSGKPL